MGINKNYKWGIFLLILLLTIISGITLIQSIPREKNFDGKSLLFNAPEDFYEPNNNITSAFDLTTHEGIWLSSINGLGTQADDDYYKIFIGFGNELLKVNLTFFHLEGDIDLGLYNPSGIPINGSSSTTDNEYIDFVVPMNGEYYLRVFGANASNNYDLFWITKVPPPPEDLYEENDDWSTATDLTSNEGMWLSSLLGPGVQYDDDWYQINILPGKEHIRIILIFDHYMGDINLQLYDNLVMLVASRTSNTSDEFMDITVSASGPYYIKVYFGNAGNPYDLWYNTTYLFDDSYEENDQEGETYDLSSSEAMWQYNLRQFDDDWYEINLDFGEERLKAEVYYNPSEGNIDLEVYDWNFMYIDGSYTSGNTEFIEIDLFAHGTYYLRVFGENKGNWYDLWWEDLIPSGATEDDWMEENDGFWSSHRVDPKNFGGLKIVQYDEDWFHLYLNRGDEIEVYIKNFDNSIGNLELELYSPSYEWKVGSYSSGNDEHIRFTLRTMDEPGDWRIRVYRVSGDPFEDVYYDLDIRVYGGREDPYEYNNHPEEAFRLNKFEKTWLSEIYGLAVQGTEDWYMIEITPGFEQLIIDLRFNITYGNIYISIMDEWGYWSMDNWSMSGLEDIDINVYVPHPGKYLINIHGDFMGNTYDLWWDDLRTDFRSDDNYEENDLPSTAYELSNEIEYWDDHGIWGKWLRDINNIGIQSDNDWYKINIEPGTDFLKLSVFILYEYSAGPIGIELYDWDISKLTSNFTMSDNEYLNYVLPSNGTYYFRIYGDNSGSPYDLRWELQEDYTEMIPGFNILILLGAIFGVSTVISIKWKRSKKNF